ncbi:MAG: type II toxin-antitoxin system HicA family toxin [Caulobacteraceae bacterium]
MNRKRHRTLEDIFANPVSGTIEWAAIEGLLVSLGCKVIEGAGSRVRFEKNGLIASFHRPHLAKEAKHYQVRDAREYLTKLGVTP